MTTRRIVSRFSLAIVSVASFALLAACSGVSPRDERAENMKRGELLVAAIQQYVDHFGSPPTSLEILVPDYLDEIPQTYGGSEFKYILTADDPKDPWWLFFELASDGSGCGYHPRLERWDCSPPGAGDV